MQNVGVSIREVPPKIKAFAQGLSGDLLIALLFVVVTFLAFGLGRFSALHEKVPEIVFVDGPYTKGAVSESIQVPTIENEQLQGAIVASKKGTKYHFPWCPGAQQMSEANKIYFQNEAEARAAGYAPASNCKGLQ